MQQQQNEQILTTDQLGDTRETAVSPATEALELVPLAEVLRQVRRDSARAPQQYLAETIVPFGGE